MLCISIVIADHCPVFLCGLISVLRSEHSFNVVASGCNGTKSLQAIRNLAPQIALLDSSLADLSGLEILAAVNSDGLHTRIVVVTAALEHMASAIAVSRGAYGVVSRDIRPQVLIYGLQQVAAGRRFSLPAFQSGKVRTRSESSPQAATDLLADLTHRERQIAHLVAAGLSNKEVGRRLSLASGTITVHLHNIYQKLAINNRTVLAAMAFSDQHERRSAQNGVHFAW